MTRVIRSAIVRFGAVCRSTATSRGLRSRGQGRRPPPPTPAATPRMHSRQNVCPQTVVTGSVSMPRQMGQERASSIAAASKPDKLPPPMASPVPLSSPPLLADAVARGAAATASAVARGAEADAGAALLLAPPPPRAGSTGSGISGVGAGAGIGGAGAAAAALPLNAPRGTEASCVSISERRLAKSASLSPGRASITSEASRCAERWRCGGGRRGGGIDAPGTGPPGATARSRHM